MFLTSMTYELLRLAREVLQTSPGLAIFSRAQSVQTFGGNFNAAGGNITIYNHHNVDLLDILKSFSLPNHRAIHQDTLAKAVAGTCVWFTEEGILWTWIERGRVLWGIGIRK